MPSVRQRTYKNHDILKPLAERSRRGSEWLDGFIDAIP